EGAFEEAFDPYCVADPDWRWPDGVRWPVVRIRGPLALVGLSTSRASGWLTAHGTVGDDQLARVEKVLVDPRLADRVRVVVMHHPSAGRWASRRLRGLTDHAAFAAVIARAGADLILHGHEHVEIAESLPGPRGPVPVRCTTSGTYGNASPRHVARYHVYTVDDGDAGAAGAGRPRIVADAVRVYRPEARAFGAAS